MDDSGLEKLARDLGKIPADMVRKLPGVVKKGATNIKNTMKKDVRQSKHFRGNKAPGLDASIDYDVHKRDVFGSHVIWAEIGPNKDRLRAASIANIAYFGSSRPGGGTIRDPVEALGEEEPNFVKYIEDATKGLL